VGLLDYIESIISTAYIKRRDDVLYEALQFLLSYHKLYPDIVNYYYPHNIRNLVQQLLIDSNRNYNTREVKHKIDDTFSFTFHMQGQ